MSRALLLLVLIATFPGTSRAQSGCPESAPGHGMIIEVGGCATSGTCACPDSTPLALDLEPTVIGVQPPGISYYPLQPCDEVTWDFGDGSAPMVAPIGTAKVTHAWPVPGNYKVTATVRNALGSMTFDWGPRVIASEPARLTWPRLPHVPETAGSFSIPVRRTGDLTRRVSARLIVLPVSAWIEPALTPAEFPLVFEPGVTERVVTLPVRDNLLHDGPREAQIVLGYPEGGVVLENGAVTIVDNEPQPFLTCDDLSVNEGDRGRTQVVIPCRLSAPLSFHVSIHAWLLEGTATSRSDFYEYIDYSSRALEVAPGTLTGAISVEILGDTEVEQDEQFRVMLNALSYNWRSFYDHSPTITILNDDAALTPSRRNIEVGDRVELTLVPGRQYDAPTAIPLRSSDPSAVAVPSSVNITAGAHSVTFVAEALAPGASSVSADLGTRQVSAVVAVHQPAAIIVSASALKLANGGTTTLRISVSPARTSPLVVRFTSDPRIVSVPAEATIPPGGEAAIQVRAVAVGGTAIGVTTGAEAVVGSSVLVDVVPPSRKRRAAR